MTAGPIGTIPDKGVAPEARFLTCFAGVLCPIDAELVGSHGHSSRHGRLPLPAGERGGVRGLRSRDWLPLTPPSPRWGEGVPQCSRKSRVPQHAPKQTRFG